MSPKVSPFQVCCSLPAIRFLGAQPCPLSFVNSPRSAPCLIILPDFSHLLSGVDPTSDREKTSQRLIQAIYSLHPSLPTLVAAKVGANYDGMAPMERFKLETLGGAATAGNLTDTAHQDVACFSCRATSGSGS